MSKIEIFKVSSPKKKNTRLSNLEKEEESQEFLVFSNNLF